MMRARNTIDLSKSVGIKHRPYLYKATSDAAWDETNSRWELTAKRLETDGTLGTIEYDKVAIGAEEDDMPIAEDDVCIEIITSEGLRALQPFAEGVYSPSRLWEATNDSTFSEDLGVWLVDAKRIDSDGSLPAEIDTEKTVAPPYRSTFLRDVGSLSPLYEGDRAIDVRMADGTIMLLKVNEDMPLPFDAKVVGGKLYIYGWLYDENMPMVQVNSQAIEGGALSIDAYWVLIDSSVTIPSKWFLNIKYEDGADYTNYNNLSWEISSSPTSFINIPLFRITEENEVAQYHRGQWDCWIVDADSKVLEILGESKTGNKGRSLERDQDHDGQLQLYQLHTPHSSKLIENEDWHFVMRQQETDGSGPIDVKYLYKADFIEWVEEEFDFTPGIGDIPPPGDYDRDKPLPGADDWSQWWASHPHEILADIRDQTVGDDHRGGRAEADAINQITGSEESVDGHPYIHANGDATRNAMTDTAALGDNAGTPSISPHSRQLYDVDGKTVVDYKDKELGTDLKPAPTDTKEVSMYWADRHLIADDNETVSLDWNDQGDNIPNLDPDTATAKDCAQSINAILAVLRQYKIIATPEA